jgi:hypothetical protein
MDRSFTPFAAAQKIMEFVDDEPPFADAPGVEDLWQAMLAFEAAGPRDRDAAEDLIRRLLLSLPAGPEAV